MAFQIDRSMHWTDHYVEHGFAVVKGVVGQEFIRPALAEIETSLKHGLPRNQWTTENTPTRSPVAVGTMDVLPRVYDQPGVRSIIDTMFGSPAQWDGKRAFHLFISPFDPKAKAEIQPEGHIDFVNCPIPIFGSGFLLQVSLVKAEPFSGNITIYPGTHKRVQKMLAENRDLRYPADFAGILKTEPFEFVAEPGDAILVHHLVGHAGNSNHAAGRSPRIGLHCQATRHTWLDRIDPAAPGNSPWERSLAFTGGPYRTPEDDEVGSPGTELEFAL